MPTEIGRIRIRQYLPKLHNPLKLLSENSAYVNNLKILTEPDN